MTPQTELNPELQLFTTLLEAQPQRVQTIVRYCLAMAMVKANRAELIHTEMGENGPMYTFTTVAGDTLTLLKPPLNQTDETMMVETLQQVVEEEEEEEGLRSGRRQVWA